ncbi:MAG: NAD-dependent DNA ligase LigA [Eubacterium sp.]|nr:NAD-dependent DNA ligase LigA [Eubacterium sp.]
MRDLVELLNKARKAYYADSEEIMDNFTYDRLYDELEALEKATGVVFSDSPTVQVGYEVTSSLPKVTHESPMLSLDKTKERDVLKEFIGSRKTLLSWKMDGLTIVLTYRNGSLYQAVTRGNGTVGEVITANARVFKGLPFRVPDGREIILRGEAYISYTDFERINAGIEDVDAKYKNPRNLCSGSVRQLDSAVTASRNVRFKAFTLVKADGVDFQNSVENQMKWLESLGFDVVEYKAVTAENLDTVMDDFAARISSNDFPSDGLVAVYDDIEYGRSLGRTAKFPRNAMAFKWADEEMETTLKEVEWSPSRTGLLNPVAIFEPVELEGTSVSRASLHNVSVLRQLKLGIGDRIKVYKANMIIPQISENLTCSGNLPIPDTCPACGGPTYLAEENDVQTLICVNPDCPAKAIKSYALFVSRDAMNMEGLSESTLEKFMAHGLIKSFGDIYRLKEHRDTIVGLEGFGEKSFQKLTDAVEASKDTDMARLLYSMGIPNIGLSGAKLIVRELGNDPEVLKNASMDQLTAIDGIGEVIAASYTDWWQSETNRKNFDEVLSFVRLPKEAAEEPAQTPLAGLTFVITGSVVHFANRSELKNFIEEHGGRVTDSVSKNTDYLINNDVTSGSSKNKKARSLGVKIISEDDFLALAES